MGNTLAYNLFQTIPVEESSCYPNMFSSIVSFYLKNIWTRQICTTLARRIFVGLTYFFFKFTFIKLKKKCLRMTNMLFWWLYNENGQMLYENIHQKKWNDQPWCAFLWVITYLPSHMNCLIKIQEFTLN